MNCLLQETLSKAMGFLSPVKNITCINATPLRLMVGSGPVLIHWLENKCILLTCAMGKAGTRLIGIIKCCLGGRGVCVCVKEPIYVK